MKKYYSSSNNNYSSSDNSSTRQVNGSAASPERAKVWTEKSPKYHYQQGHHRNQNQNQNKNQHKQQQQKKEEDSRVPVVYYLCRNRQLEHPHFIEVPLSSPDGLYLRGKDFNKKGKLLC